MALATSVRNTLSIFYLCTSCSWNPNYPSLLPFTQLTGPLIGFSCDNSCSLSADDGTVTDLAQTTPGLHILQLCGQSLRETPIGATIKGLTALTGHHPDVPELCAHFQVTNLRTPPAIHEMASNTWSTTLRRDCTLAGLDFRETSARDGLGLIVALTLTRISPHFERTNHLGRNWRFVDTTSSPEKSPIPSVRNAPSTPWDGFSYTPAISRLA